MNTYSFRAEFPSDANAFLQQAYQKDITLTHFIPDRDMPDVVVQFSSEYSLEDFRAIMRTIPDSHVMIQTLQPKSIKDSDIERDYGIE